MSTVMCVPTPEEQEEAHRRTLGNDLFRDAGHLLLSANGKRRYDNPPVVVGTAGRGSGCDPIGAGARRLPVVTSDPVLDRRRRIARLVSIGQRVGYGLFGLAVVLFLVGFATGFGTVGSVIVVCIVVGSVVLAPAIVFGYAVGAAEREDRQEGRPTLGEPTDRG